MHQKFHHINVKASILLSTLFVFLCSCNLKQKNKSNLKNMKIANHSYSNYTKVKISHIDLDFDISFEQQRIDVQEVIDFIVLDSTANNLILDIKGLNIKQVKNHVDEPVTFETSKEDSVLGQALIIPLDNLKDNQVKISYQTTEHSEALQWQNPEQTKGKNHPFLFTQSQAILARTWIPLQDCPAVRFTYNARVKMDKDLLPLMSASNPQSKSENGIYTFEMKQPIPSYLMALAVGDLKFVSLGENCGVYAEPIWVDECALEFEDLTKMIKEASKLYGPYRWGRYDIVMLPPSFPFGGMENPRLTFATPTIIAGDKSLVSLVAHELAHSWSGNLVTNETWSDFWLNEGFTVYFESRIMEQIAGKDYANMLEVLGMGDLKNTLAELDSTNPDDTKLYLELEGRNPDDGVTDIAYEKGRFFLLRIEQVVGRKRFDQFLNEYFSKRAFKTINTQQFINALKEDLLSEKKEWQDAINIRQWVYESGLPSTCPVPNSVYFEQVEADVKAFENEAILPNTEGYTTHHWLHFLRNLNEGQRIGKLEKLDSAFNLTQSGNSEIACDWFKHAISSKYSKAYPALQDFLIKVGRRKFLTPLYTRMINTDQKKLANSIYNEAKAGYHAVSNATISALLNE
jgi:leukotriene A-4 hydrolase/aminopeptidase